jgi:hypothetical protein
MGVDDGNPEAAVATHNIDTQDHRVTTGAKATALAASSHLIENYPEV